MSSQNYKHPKKRSARLQRQALGRPPVLAEESNNPEYDAVIAHLRSTGAGAPPPTPQTQDLDPSLPAAHAPDTRPSGLSGMSAGGIPSGHLYGPSPQANERYDRMGAEMQERSRSARSAVTGLADHYAQNPEAYIERQQQARDAELARSGIQDMGGGQRIMNNPYGSGYAAPRAAGVSGPPARFYDEKGEVDLEASREAGHTVYKRDASGDIVPRPTSAEARTEIQRRQNEIAGAGRTPGAPDTPEARRAADRQQGVSSLKASPEFADFRYRTAVNKDLEEREARNALARKGAGLADRILGHGLGKIAREAIRASITDVNEKSVPKRSDFALSPPAPDGAASEEPAVVPSSAKAAPALHPMEVPKPAAALRTVRSRHPGYRESRRPDLIPRP